MSSILKKNKKIKKKVTFVLPEKKEEKKKQLNEQERTYLRNLLRTQDMFLSNYGAPFDLPEDM